MIEELLKSADRPLQELLATKGGNPDAAGTVRAAFLSLIQKQTSAGNFDGLMEMFSGKETDPESPAVNHLKGDLVSELSGKLGIDTQNALSIASAALPMLFNLFNKRINDAPQANEEIQQSVIKSVKGETNSGLGGVLSSIFGTDENPRAIDLDGIINLGKSLFDKR